VTGWRTWCCAVGLAAIVALVGTVLETPLGMILGIGFFLASFGALMALGFRADLPRIRYPVLLGAVLFTAPALYPGLARILGQVPAVLVVGLLAATCPAVAPRVVRRLRGRLLPSQEELAVMAPHQEALRLQWEESTRQLNRASSERERVLILSLREQILDDIARQSAGALPEYVWASACDPGGRRSSAGA
jgi:hypothetical protein